MQTAHFHSVFLMVIACFDPARLPIDLCQELRSMFLGAYNSVQAHHFASLELDSHNATIMSVFHYRKRILRIPH
jgi:hypothetical protein